MGLRDNAELSSGSKREVPLSGARVNRVRPT